MAICYVQLLTSKSGGRLFLWWRHACPLPLIGQFESVAERYVRVVDDDDAFDPQPPPAFKRRKLKGWQRKRKCTRFAGPTLCFLCDGRSKLFTGQGVRGWLYEDLIP